MRDRVQYTVKARYIEDVVLREVLTENPQIERLRRAGYADEDATFERRLGLGESIVRALEERRPADADTLLDELGEAGEGPTGACHPGGGARRRLPDRAQRGGAFERRVGAIARKHGARLEIRLVGPSPAYDFVGSG